MNSISTEAQINRYFTARLPIFYNSITRIIVRFLKKFEDRVTEDLNHGQLIEDFRIDIAFSDCMQYKAKAHVCVSLNCI